MTGTTVKKPQSIFALIGTDVSAEEDGRWFNDIFGTADKEDGIAGVDVKLRRLTSKAALKVRQKLEREARVGLNRTAPIPQDVIDKLIVEQLARAVIIDWRGFIGEDGETIEFSPETAIDLLTRLPNLRVSLYQMALDLDNFRAEQREQIEGN